MGGGHEPLNYLLRLRGTPDGIVDLAGNTWTSQSNVSIIEDDFIKFNSGYITYNIQDIIEPNEDFTFSVWIEVYECNQGYAAILFGSKVDPDIPRVQTGDFSFFFGMGNKHRDDYNYVGTNWEISPVGGSGTTIFRNPIDYILTGLHHCCCTRKSNVCYCFLDGELISKYTLVGQCFPL